MAAEGEVAVGAESRPAPEEDLADALLEARLIEPAALERARRASARGEARLERAIVELGLIEEERLGRFLADWLGLPYLEAADFELLPVAELGGQGAFLRRAEVAPARMDAGRLLLAMADPFDAELPRTLGFMLDLGVDRAVASRRAIHEVLARDYPVAGERPDTTEGAADDHDLERLRSLANEGPVVKLVNDLVTAAVEAGASDIHVESFEGEMTVRLRVDGELRRHAVIPSSQRSAVVSRLKVMADLNISERRRPQDGRIRLAVRGRNVDLRVSTLPTQFGESIVLRVLDRTRLALDWERLGFEPEMIARIEHLVGRPHGIFLVTGPTGAGKTTTLYTALSRLDAAGRKIITVEDPIEYTLPGINQVQVHGEIGLTFASALQSILRQDPNVVMVGEIRNLETAENAIRAALMGRMVLSTVHTNSAVGAIDRLTDFGVPAFLLAATLRGVLSQRLVRRLCPHCAEPDPEGADALAAFNRPAPGPGARLLRALGCEACGGIGYRGRIVIGELLEFTPEVHRLVASAAGREAVAEAARRQGMEELLQAGLRLAGSGTTSISEIFQVVDW